MNLEDLTEAQKARAKECKTPEELMALAKEEGVELSDEELDGVAGGMNWQSQNSWRESIARAKSSGWSLSQFLEYVQNKCSRSSEAFRNEIVGFICDNW